MPHMPHIMTCLILWHYPNINSTPCRPQVTVYNFMGLPWKCRVQNCREVCSSFFFLILVVLVAAGFVKLFRTRNLHDNCRFFTALLLLIYFLGMNWKRASWLLDWQRTMAQSLVSGCWNLTNLITSKKVVLIVVVRIQNSFPKQPTRFPLYAWHIVE